MLLIALAVAVVFWFALHAKTGVYGNNNSAKITSATSAKMWLNGQKATVEPSAQTGALLIWFAILFIHFLHLHRKFHIESSCPTPDPVRLRLLNWSRYLRPPPIR